MDNRRVLHKELKDFMIKEVCQYFAFIYEKFVYASSIIHILEKRMRKMHVDFLFICVIALIFIIKQDVINVHNLQTMQSLGYIKLLYIC